MSHRWFDNRLNYIFQIAVLTMNHRWFDCIFQIAVMQTELRELQPRLIETSRETEELIGIIEKETAEVEEVKKVVEVDEATANKAASGAKAIKVHGITGAVNSSPLDKMAAILADDTFKCIFLNEKFSIWFKFHWSWFLRVQLTISEHWFS